MWKSELASRDVVAQNTDPADYAADDVDSDPLTQITITGLPNSPEANPSTVTIDPDEVDAITGGGPSSLDDGDESDTGE
jgi:hypothetical protein